jgi:hypothetical protein
MLGRDGNVLDGKGNDSASDRATEADGKAVHELQTDPRLAELK